MAGSQGKTLTVEVPFGTFCLLDAELMGEGLDRTLGAPDETRPAVLRWAHAVGAYDGGLLVGCDGRTLTIMAYLNDSRNGPEFVGKVARQWQRRMEDPATCAQLAWLEAAVVHASAGAPPSPWAAGPREATMTAKARMLRSSSLASRSAQVGPGICAAIHGVPLVIEAMQVGLWAYWAFNGDRGVAFALDWAAAHERQRRRWRHHGTSPAAHTAPKPLAEARFKSGPSDIAGHGGPGAARLRPAAPERGRELPGHPAGVRWGGCPERADQALRSLEQRVPSRRAWAPGDRRCRHAAPGPHGRRPAGAHPGVPGEAPGAASRQPPPAAAGRGARGGDPAAVGAPPSRTHASSGRLRSGARTAPGSSAAPAVRRR